MRIPGLVNNVYQYVTGDTGRIKTENIVEPVTPEKVLENQNTVFNNPRQDADEKPQEAGKKEPLDFSAQLDLQTDKDLIGSEKELHSLDITKQLSSVKRDNVLQEYLYFVNDVSREDGFVIRKNK